MEGDEVGDDGFEGEGEVPRLGSPGSEESVARAEDVHGGDLAGKGPEGPGYEPAPGEVGGIAESIQYLQKKGRREVLQGHLRQEGASSIVDPSLDDVPCCGRRKYPKAKIR